VRECARSLLGASYRFPLPFSLHKKGKPNTFASVDECYPMLLLLSLLSLHLIHLLYPILALFSFLCPSIDYVVDVSMLNSQVVAVVEIS
jgi:hypothetical protein